LAGIFSKRPFYAIFRGSDRNTGTREQEGLEMNIVRGFLLVGAAYLLIGIIFGIYMGASGNHDLTPVHAHINLLGFTLMMVFGLTYHTFSNMAENTLAKAHFWLHQIGTLGLVVMLFLFFSGAISESGMAPIAPIAEILILLGVLAFSWNLVQNAK